MPESPVEWAALAYKMLGFKAPLEVFYAADMRCAKLRICIKEPLTKSHMAANGGLDQRFRKGDLFQHKRKGSKCHP